VARQNPKGSASLAASVTSPVVAAVMAAALERRLDLRPRPWATRIVAQSTWRSRSPHRPGDRRIGVSATADGGLDHRQGQQALDDMGGRGLGHLGGPAVLGHQRVEPGVVGQLLPLVVAGPRDREDPAGLRHVVGPLGVLQHRDAALVDDLCWGHGAGLLGSLVGTTESIAVPRCGVDVQPHLPVRKL